MKEFFARVTKAETSRWKHLSFWKLKARCLIQDRQGLTHCFAHSRCMFSMSGLRSESLGLHRYRFKSHFPFEMTQTALNTAMTHFPGMVFIWVSVIFNFHFMINLLPIGLWPRYLISLRLILPISTVLTILFLLHYLLSNYYVPGSLQVVKYRGE